MVCAIHTRTEPNGDLCGCSLVRLPPTALRAEKGISTNAITLVLPVNKVQTTTTIKASPCTR